MLWMMFKFFLIYLVVVFFLGIFRTWRAVRRAQKAFGQAHQSTVQKKNHPSDGVVEAEYRILDENK